jgi:hypothetical protein
MQGSSDRAHPSRKQRGVERNNCMARCQARWDAISPARDGDTRRAGKDACVALSTRLHDAPPSATAQALLDGQRYRRDTCRRNNSKRADTSVKAEPRRVTNLFAPAGRPGRSTRGSRDVRDVCAADRCATRCPPSTLTSRLMLVEPPRRAGQFFGPPDRASRHESPWTGVSSRPPAATAVAGGCKRPRLQPLRAVTGLAAPKAGSTGDARHRLDAGPTERLREMPPRVHRSASPRFRSQRTDRVVVSVLSQLW